MKFTEAIKTYYRRYVDFGGRSIRSEYWWFQLYFYLVVLALALPLFMGGFDMQTEEIIGLGWISVVGLGLWVLAHIIGNISLAVRRFHDLNQTGWLVLAFTVGGALPVVGTLVSLANVVWFCFRGTDGPNTYGRDPLGGHEAEIFS